MEKRKVFFSRLKRRFFKRLWLARLTTILLGLMFVVGLGLGIDFFFKKTGLAVYTSFAKDFIFASQDKVANPCATP